MPGGPNLFSVSEQNQWCERIRREVEANGQYKNHFAVRSALGSADVPLHFKPLHMVPKVVDVPPDDPSRDLKLEQEVQEILSARRSTRREHQPWPETSQQAVGWLQAPVGELGSPRRVGMNAGLNPNLGIGWMNGREAAERRQRLGLQVAGSVMVANDSISAFSSTVTPLSARITDEERGHQQLADAAAKSKKYLPRGQDSKWHRPKGTCDVVDFGDRYTRAFGTNLFASSSPK